VAHQGQDPQRPGEAGAPPPGGYPPPYQGQPAAGSPPPQGQPGAPPHQAQPGGMAQQGPVQEAGLEPPVANLLSYLFLGLGGLIVFLTQKHREVRFHGAQSLLLGITLAVLYIGLSIIFGILTSLISVSSVGTALAVSGITTIVFLVLVLGAFILQIYMCVQGYQQRHVKLPVIGDLAEKWAGPAPRV